jgi:hypothetical protein
MPRRKQVKDENNLVRDVDSNAIVSNNPVEFSSYLKQKAIRDNMAKRIDQHDEEMKSLKKDMLSIKKLLKEIAEKL